MTDRLADRYDPSLNDSNESLGALIDPKSSYLRISSWREEAWRNAEQLRHARAAGWRRWAAVPSETGRDRRIGGGSRARDP